MSSEDFPSDPPPDARKTTEEGRAFHTVLAWAAVYCLLAPLVFATLPPRFFPKYLLPYSTAMAMVLGLWSRRPLGFVAVIVALLECWLMFELAFNG